MGVSTGIRVDLTALTKVLWDLRRDVDQGMTPSTQGATGELGDTARFGGASASGEVVAGATDVSYAASIAAHNIGVHIDNAYAIASLIEGAVAGYRAADALAGREFSSLSAGTPTAGPPAGGASAASDAGLTPVFVGPLPAPKIPPQALTEAPHTLRWEAYDTPRIWSMVAGEVSDAAWHQMHAFRRLSDLLDEQHRRMLALRERLVAAWTPVGAGAQVLQAWDDHTVALATDAMCAHLTSKALGGILETLSDARSKLSRLRENWNWITRDFVPESWDHAAENNNNKARLVMMEAERAIADYRKHIAVPEQARPLQVDQVEESVGPGSRRSGAGSHNQNGDSGSTPSSSGQVRTVTGRPGGLAISAPPSIPGADPIHGGPELAGSSNPVPLSPLNPPSLLPIPPGVGPTVPDGGAYVLPGPWSGEGRVLQMPGSGPSLARQGVSPAGTGLGAPGMYGIPTGSRGDGKSSYRQRMATEQWEVAVGGPAVIGSAQPWRIEEGAAPSKDLLEKFEEWITITGYPWDASAKDDTK